MENPACGANSLSTRVRGFMTIFCLLLLWTGGNTAEATQLSNPLTPPDTSSPRATLKTFLESSNQAAEAFKKRNRPEAITFIKRAMRCLNLEKEPPALRLMTGFYAALYLKETLDRVDIPPYADIPDANAVENQKISTWTIPNTEISLAAVKDASSITRFLFTSDTVANAEKYYRKINNLPFKPGSGSGALLEQLRISGSLLVPKTFVDRLPNWAKADIYGQAVWQWFGLALYLFVGAGTILLLYKGFGTAFDALDRRLDTTLRHTAGGLILPVTLIIFARTGLWFLIYGLRFLNADAYVPVALVFLLVSYVGIIWLIGAVLNRIAGVFVSVGGFVRGGTDAQLIRLSFQIVTLIVISIVVIHLGARLGLPTYSLVTGLGVGGIAVALAGREALSNVIGSIMIILDRPFKLGDYIVLGEGERGEVAAVGLRSTRIRTRDDILISIPNSVIANSKMINESAPVPMSRIRIKVGVAYGSDLQKVEHILLRVAEANKIVLSDPVPRVRFRSFGDSALDLELLCWIHLPELRGETIHELNWAIHEEFQSNGIQIPFPQRDLHIRGEK